MVHTSFLVPYSTDLSIYIIFKLKNITSENVSAFTEHTYASNTNTDV